MKLTRFSLTAFAMLSAACGNPASSPSATSDASAAEALRHHRALRLKQTNLVSDQAGVAATQDPNLVNPWGIAFNPHGPAWISNNGTGTTTVYDPAGALLLTVGIPGAAGAKSSPPTGQVFNASSDFNGDLFIFATEDGTLSGWQPKTGAAVHVDNSGSGAVYKGLALGHSMLYVANFHAGTVDVFDANYQPAQISGDFVDPYLPAGYAPFNVFASGEQVFVAYALQNDQQHDDVAGAGFGFISLFDAQGNFQQRLISQGALNAPWAMALAPAGFGNLGGDLLVGNFGDGHINSFSMDDNGYGTFDVRARGALADLQGNPLAIDGLWAFAFGPDAGGSNSKQLYFTAGPAGETHGLYGRLELP